MASTKAWIEAMRLHTLPVSVAGVISAAGAASYFHSFKALQFTICLLFAIGAQIVSNFANEYFDYVNGLDKKGREGFRRGVTEGDISPKAMKRATFGLLAAVCALGCSLIIWGGWWLIPVGIAIALFALGYSTGPYPLSHHGGLGEIAVVVFFGIVPVCLTTYLQTGTFSNFHLPFWLSLSIGFMATNVLVVNNYRDKEADAAVGKQTLAVRYGDRAMERLFIANGFLALVCIEVATALVVDPLWQIGPLIYINMHYLIWMEMKQEEGSGLNGVLRKTALLMLGMSVWILAALTLGVTPPIGS